MDGATGTNVPNDPTQPARPPRTHPPCTTHSPDASWGKDNTRSAGGRRSADGPRSPDGPRSEDNTGSAGGTRGQENTRSTGGTKRGDGTRSADGTRSEDNTGNAGGARRAGGARGQENTRRIEARPHPTGGLSIKVTFPFTPLSGRTVFPRTAIDRAGLATGHRRDSSSGFHEVIVISGPRTSLPPRLECLVHQAAVWDRTAFIAAMRLARQRVVGPLTRAVRLRPQCDPPTRVRGTLIP
jgi:hypothetical protein